MGWQWRQEGSRSRRHNSWIRRWRWRWTEREMERLMGTLRSLEATEFLTQDAEPSGTTLVDARNGFSELSRFVIL